MLHSAKGSKICSSKCIQNALGCWVVKFSYLEYYHFFNSSILLVAVNSMVKSIVLIKCTVIKVWPRNKKVRAVVCAGVVFFCIKNATGTFTVVFSMYQNTSVSDIPRNDLWLQKRAQTCA